MLSVSGMCCQECSTNNNSREAREEESNLEIIDYNLTAFATSQASPLVLAPMMQSSARLSRQHSTVEAVLSEYIAACKFYGGSSSDRINAGVLTCFRYSLPCLRTNENFHDTDMLALSEVLLRYANGPLRYIKRLDFSISGAQKKMPGQPRGFGSHGAVALAKVLQMSEHVEEVRLQRNSVGPYGASAIFLACSQNRHIRKLAMRRCLVGERGALVFAEAIAGSAVCGISEVDLSANFIGQHGSTAVEHAVQKRTESDFSLMTVDLEGNLVFQEVMNAVTHGLGLLLAFLASYLMSARVAHLSLRHVLSTGVYSLSLIVLYSSSTLYHSFFILQNTKYIFEVLDKCAIYILIAGSYTPFLQIVLAHEPLWSTWLLGFIWCCCVFGIIVEASLPVWRYKRAFSLAMYLGMGWASIVCLPAVAVQIPDNAIRLMILGGVAYTVGIPFFVRNNNIDHAIWHIFVLAGSTLHWLGVYLYVAAWTDSPVGATS
jgi:hemolysin III